jgi:hypothetical protein
MSYKPKTLKLNQIERGYFELTLPSSGRKVECKLLNVGEQRELKKYLIVTQKVWLAPIATKRLEKQIVSLDGDDNKAIYLYIHKSNAYTRF